MIFFQNKGPFELNYLLKQIKLPAIPNITQKVDNVATLSVAKKNDLTFFDNVKYIKNLENTKASFCFILEKYKNIKNINKTHYIFSSNPLIDFINTCKIFYPKSDTDICDFKINKKFIKYKTEFNTFVDDRVKIGSNFSVGLNTVIKKNVIIGENVSIGSNCVISNAIIGDNVIINDGSVIGKIGFGFKSIEGKLCFIPHFGHVNICDDVYIGSNCTIDRGSFSNTSIGKGCMIDNQVHIAHNVKIGADCFIAGQSGIAGSTNIGNRCMIGGKTGISGHLSIGDDVYIGGQSGVLKNVESKKKIMGYPATSMKSFIKRAKYD